MHEPAVSIVVPTRDRPDALARCLAALARQRGGRREIVVVDDGSGDPESVARAVAVAPTARLVPGGGEGPAAARNAGARAAVGEVLCFTDDDCEPQPAWSERLAGAALAAGAAAGTTVCGLAGKALPEASQAIAGWLQQGSLDPGSGRLGFAPTCNLACTAAVAARLPFDPSFPLAAGEDREWCARAAAAGVAPRFVPGAIVVHDHPLGPVSFLRQHYRYGRGGQRYRVRANRRRGPGDARTDRRRAARARDRSLDPARPDPLAALTRRELLAAAFARGGAVGLAVLAAQGATAVGVGREIVTPT